MPVHTGCQDFIRRRPEQEASKLRNEDNPARLFQLADSHWIEFRHQRAELGSRTTEAPGLKPWDRISNCSCTSSHVSDQTRYRPERISAIRCAVSIPMRRLGIRIGVILVAVRENRDRQFAALRALGIKHEISSAWNRHALRDAQAPPAAQSDSCQIPSGGRIPLCR